jgi:hypothetical protein
MMTYYVRHQGDFTTLFEGIYKEIDPLRENNILPPSLLFLDEDLGRLHFLFTIFYFFLNYAWVLSISKLIAY